MSRANYVDFTQKYVDFTNQLLTIVARIPHKSWREVLTVTNSCLHALLEKNIGTPKYLGYVSNILATLKQIPLEYWDGIFYLIQEYDEYLKKREITPNKKTKGHR